VSLAQALLGNPQRNSWTTPNRNASIRGCLIRLLDACPSWFDTVFNADPPPMFENDLLSRKGMLVKELAQEIRTLQTAHRPQGVHVSSGCQPMDRCLPSGGYAAGSLLELTCKHKPRTSGWGGLSLALKIAKPWLDDGKYLVVVDSHRRLCAPSLVALKIPLERLIVIRSENAADWVWGLDQALRSPAVGALISPVNELDDRSARRLQLAVEQGGGLGIFLRDQVSAKRNPSWAEVQWQVQSVSTRATSSSLSTMTLSQPSAPSVLMERWFDLELLRAPGFQSTRRVRLGIDAQGEWKHCDERKSPKSAEHLAAQLALATPRRPNVAAS